MKKAFQSIMAFVLAVMLMTSVCCIPGVFASTETVNTAHLHGTGNATLATDEIFLAPGTTYTVSFLWKAVQGDARVQLSGTAVGNKTRTLIVDGSYTMSGTDYDWQTGRVTYTFTASGDALVLSALQATNEDIEFYIGDVSVYASDADGVAVTDGEVIDLPFAGQNYEWILPSSDYIGFEDKAVDFFALESAPSGGTEKILIFKVLNDWEERTFYKEVEVTSGKTYTFTMYYKSISANNTGNIMVNNTSILEGGRYGTVNGAVYDGYTGLISYTFTADSSTVKINMENRLGQEGKHKEYAIACPKIFESDENGVAVDGGEVIDCDDTFDSWSWASHTAQEPLPSSATVELGTPDFFVTKTANEQPEDGIYVMTYANGSDQRNVSYTVDVTAGTEYTFSMYYKDLGGNNSAFYVNGTEIIHGGYNVLNGAAYDATTGKVTYTFTAASNTVTVANESRCDDKSIQYKNFMMADPRLVSSDENIGCNLDFSQWVTVFWGSAIENQFTVTVGQYDDFPTVFPVHTQPEESGKVYVGTFNEWFNDSWVGYSVNVESGKTYTFSMLYKFGKGEDVLFTLSGNALSEEVVLAKNADAVNAQYDPYTGRYSYTFTAVGDTLTINLKTGSAKNQYIYWVADPQLVDSDNNSVDCDVDFCRWSTDGLYNRHGYFSIDVGDASFFATAIPVHTQPENGVYAFSQNANWENGVWYYDAKVTQGKTYTFSMLYKDLGGNKNQIIIGGDAAGDANHETVIVDGGLNIQNGAVYNYYTGRISYTFTAYSDTVQIRIEGRGEDIKYGNFMVADPQLIDSDNNSVNCDVDFCSWKHAVWGEPTCDLETTVIDPLLFGNPLVTGDANADGAFNILDLVSLKKYLAGMRSELYFDALGSAGNVDAGTLATVRLWLLNGTEVLTKTEVLSVLNSNADSNGYAIGTHTCGNTDVNSCMNSFSSAMNEMPGYVDFDMHSLPFVSQSEIDRAVTQLTLFAMPGVGSADGFITLTSHWLSPTVNLADASLAGADNSRYVLTAEQYNAVMTPGTTENANFLQELAIDAAFIQRLKDNGVSVIFRPMHEGNQAYFWWGVNEEQGITPAMYANLYRYVHDYFTVTCGLDNILWQFNVDRPGYDQTTVAAMYPGDNYVDTVSMDWYLSAASSPDELYNHYLSLMSISGNKPFAIAEFGGYADYDIYNISFDTTLGYVDGVCAKGAKIAYVGPYLNWADITR